jgi:uncharacterized protein YutE (UPF0331/DUF86 family)
VPDDVIVGKAEIVERCVRRVREVYADDPRNLRDDQTKQDAILLNLQRACQASVDLAMRIVRMRSLGVPKETRQAFRLLEEAKLISPLLSASLQKMVGFRNVAIHDYQVLSLEVVDAVIRTRLADLLELNRIGLAL